MAASDMYDDWTEEEPSGFGVSPLETWGNYMFIDGLANAKLEFLALRSTEPTDIRLIGRPHQEHILPFLTTRKRQPLASEVGKLYAFRSAWKLRVVRYFGPKGDEEDRSPAAAQLHWIDDWSPHKRREFRDKGERPPKMFASLVSARAPTVSRTQARFNDFWSENNMNSSVREGTLMLFTTAMCMNHGRVECSPESPVAALMLLNYSAMRSLETLVFAERPDYRLPDNATHDILETYDELGKRFMTPDLVNPAGAPVLRVSYHKQKAKARSGGGGKSSGGFQGNRYECNVIERSNGSPAMMAADEKYQHGVYRPPEELFKFMTPEEQRELVLGRASDGDWADFIVSCLRGTYLEVAPQERGFQAEDRAEAAKAAEAQDLRGAIGVGGNDDAFIDGNDEAPVEQDRLGTFDSASAYDRGLGDPVPAKAGEAPAKSTPVAQAMALPDGASAFNSRPESAAEPAVTTTADDPNEVERSRLSAEERLKRLSS